jgi:choline kinase
MINRIVDCGIIIVTGFKKDKFTDIVNKFNNCTVINNPFYSVTNSIASLWFARDYLNDEVIIINADVILEEELFKKITNTNDYAAVFYDSSIGENADYKVAETDGKIVVMSKELREYSGEYIGVSKFSPDAAKMLKIKIEKMINDGLINEWYETALVDMIFNDGLVLSGIDAAYYDWTEIDNVNDLIKKSLADKFK